MKKTGWDRLKRVFIVSFCAAAAAANLAGHFADPGNRKLRVERFSGPEIVSENVTNGISAYSGPEERHAPDISEPESTAYEKEGRHSGLIDINSAGPEELQTLKGIGPAKAKAIIDYRKRYGGFTCIEEITEVKGIGEKTFEKLKDMICVSDDT